MADKERRFAGKKILLYGAGKTCRLFLKEVDLEKIDIVGIADRNADSIRIDGFKVEKLGYFIFRHVDYIVITTRDEFIEEIEKDLVERYGCPKEMIIRLEEFLYYLQPCLY